MPQCHPPRTHRLCAAIALTLGGLLSVSAAQAGTAAVITLSSLDGSNGFRLDGVAANDYSGYAVSGAGDINGDGVDDVIVGAYLADPNAIGSAGSSYVVFGRSTGFNASINLSTLDGSNGFRVDGRSVEDVSGRAVSAAGDVNGDGIDDLIIGALLADPDGVTDAGSSYVLFGRTAGFDAAIDLSTLNGNNGFHLQGARAGDLSGYAVSAAGDINGDDIDDLVVGTYLGSSGNGGVAGSSYVVFGRTDGFDETIHPSSLDGSTGFRLDGAASGVVLGQAVSAAGDINGDGIDDLIVGALSANPNGLTVAGSSYVVFGRTGSFNAVIEVSTLDGINGFRLDGVAAHDRSGVAVSAAGDINGDGIDDLIVGADEADPGGVIGAGSSYVVFGRTGSFDATINLSTLDGSNGFRLDGVANLDNSGRAVSAAGDINSDGIDDLIIGAFRADPSVMNAAGSSYVVFGRTGSFDAVINLSTLDGSNGFRLDGVAANDQSGRAVSAAGDVNGDGADDVIIGAFGADPNDATNAGSSYVVFGTPNGIFCDSFESSGCP